MEVVVILYILTCMQIRTIQMLPENVHIQQIMDRMLDGGEAIGTIADAASGNFI